MSYESYESCENNIKVALADLEKTGMPSLLDNNCWEEGALHNTGFPFCCGLNLWIIEKASLESTLKEALARRVSVLVNRATDCWPTPKAIREYGGAKIKDLASKISLKMDKGTLVASVLVRFLKQGRRAYVVLNLDPSVDSALEEKGFKRIPTYGAASLWVISNESMHKEAGNG